MLDVIVKNYQSVVDARIKINGVTIIKGESNEGKSSILKALYAATHNRFKAGIVRYGQDACQVKIKLPEDGEVIDIMRMPTGSPIIKYKGQRWSKLNRDMPPEVAEALNLATIPVSNSEKYSLHFFKQFQPPLLVEFSQKKVMDILSTSEAVDDLNAVRKELDIMRTKNRGEFAATSAVLTNVKVTLSELAFRLEELQPLEDIGKEMSVYQELQSREQALYNLKVDLEKKEIELKRLEAIKTIIEVKSSLDTMVTKDNLLKDIKTAIKLQQNLENYQVIVERSIEYQEAFTKYKDLNDLSNLMYEHSELLKYADAFDFYITLRGEYEHLNEREELLDIIKSDIIALDYYDARNLALDKVMVIKTEAAEVQEKKLLLQGRNSQLLALRMQLESYFTLKERQAEIDLMLDGEVCPYCKTELKAHDINSHNNG